MSDRAKTKIRARIRTNGAYSVSVVRSNKNLRAQLVTPAGEVITGLSTLAPEIKKSIKHGGNKEAAATLGKIFAKKISKIIAKLGVDKLAFDRSGYRYHGRVQAFAQSLRDAGIIA